MIRKRIGFENNTVTVAQYEELQKAAPGVEWSGVNGLIENVRAVKDADELALTQKTIDLAEDGLRYLLSIMKPGMTETAGRVGVGSLLADTRRGGVELRYDRCLGAECGAAASSSGRAA